MTAPVQVGPSASNGGPIPVLSAVQLAVLEGRAHGLTGKQLSAKFSYSDRGIEHASTAILRKLGARDMAHAVFIACQAGILDGRPQRHGDHAGFAAHRYRGEEPCAACWEGERAYRRAQKSARRAANATAA